ncbi:flagellar hook-associated protein FlgL [Patulibacter defluvii]|uniref:flagellar hook-associated protein FlgL n=1 Tax=Patulibacter defluvii TaxID=3095358 RepID=UPI002A75D8B3|nr:flagellar hook-associated protein FlgL [Patulibacter sp. DM4]
MSARITNGMLHRSVLGDLNGSAARLGRTYQQMSSGQRITRPSDDPYGTARALTLRQDLSEIGQHLRNVQDGQGWTQASDAALGEIADSVRRARTLVVGAGNDVGGQAARTAAAAEIDQLIDAIKGAANSSYGGNRLFAGAATGTAPYAVGASDAYAGDHGTITRTIGPAVDLPINADLGGRVLGEGGGDGLLLSALRDVAAHLRGGTVADADALRGHDLRQLDLHLASLTQVRTEVGAAGNRLDGAQARLEQLRESADDQRSRVEEADAASTMIDYATQQAAYQAALRAGSSIVQLSLIDFLR